MATQANGPVDATQEFEPFILPVFFSFAFSCASVAYAEVVPQPSCFDDAILSAGFFLLLLLYLAGRTFRNSRLQPYASVDTSLEPIAPWSFGLLCLTPAILAAAHAARSCAEGASVPQFYYQAFVIIMCASFLFSVASLLSVSTATKATRSLSKHAMLPSVLISLFLSLGSPKLFGYLVGVVPDNWLNLVLDIRYLIIAIVVLLVVLDAFFLSKSLGVIWARVQSIAEKRFSIRAVDFHDQNALLVFGLSFLNIIVGLARFIFQATTTIGFAAVDFLTSLAIAGARFVIGGGAVVGIVITAITVMSMLMMLESLHVAQYVRASLEGKGSQVEYLFIGFGAYFLLFCLALSYLCYGGRGRISSTLDSAAKMGGLGILGAWICSILLHLVASITSVAELLRLNAPGFAGWWSLGWFFWIVALIAAAGSAYALVWIIKADTPKVQ